MAVRYLPKSYEKKIVLQTTHSALKGEYCGFLEVAELVVRLTDRKIAALPLSPPDQAGTFLEKTTGFRLLPH